MSKTLAVINTAADTFQVWVNRTNDLVGVLDTETVTVNAAANGALTTGNGFVEGTFGARNLVANTLRGGTVQTPGVLTLTSNLTITGVKLTLGDIVINSGSIAVNGVAFAPGLSKFVTATIGTTAQQADFFDKTLYQGVDYTISIKDTNANAYQITKLLLVHDSGNSYITEYGDVTSNGSLALFSANANSTHCRVYLTPTVANTRVSGTRITVDI